MISTTYKIDVHPALAAARRRATGKEHQMSVFTVELNNQPGELGP